jgi:hypothetical protein
MKLTIREVAQNEVLTIHPGDCLGHEGEDISRGWLGPAVVILNTELCDQNGFAKSIVPQILIKSQ